MKKKCTFISLLLVSIMILTAGCGSTASTNTTTATAKQDIVVANNGEFTTMDPADTNDNLSFSVQKTIMEGLFGFDKNMKVIPLLAQSYTGNSDATQYTIKLKKGIKFQDGTAFNAEAVKANLDRLADQTQNLKRNSLFKMVDKTEAVDSYTVKITLKYSFGAFINTLAHPAALIVSPDALKKYGKDIKNHPVGTGPYKFKEWTPGSKTVVIKNANYWNGKPSYNSITFKPVKEDGSRIAMLKTGEADFIYPVPAQQLSSLSKDKKVKVNKTPSIYVYYVSLNVNKKPFDNVKVRQALNYAVDKEQYCKTVQYGNSKPIKSVLASTVQFYSAQTEYKANLTKAKELLKEAGYPNGFSTTLWCANSSSSINSCEFIQQQLAQIGVTVKVVPTETATLTAKLWSAPKGSKGEVEMYFGGWSPSTGDADWGIRPLLASESFPPVSYNTAYYSSAECDQYVQDGLLTADVSKRKQAYAKAQKVIWNDAPWIFLDSVNNTCAYDSSASNLGISPDGIMSVTTPSK